MAEPLPGQVPVYWTRSERPDKFEILDGYCDRDVEVQTLLHDKLRPLPASEREVMLADMEVNDRGVHIDMESVRGALKIIATGKRRLDKEMARLTKQAVTKTSEVTALTEWLNANGLAVADLQKDTLARVLADPSLDPLLRQVVQLRVWGSKSSTSKLAAMKHYAANDNRARGLHIFHGAASTGRFCLPGWSPVVVLHRGTVRVVRLVNVTRRMQVWDGREWVRHKGVVFSGVHKLIEHDGVVASANHKVFISDSVSVTLAEAKAGGTPIWPGLSDIPAYEPIREVLHRVNGHDGGPAVARPRHSGGKRPSAPPAVFGDSEVWSGSVSRRDDRDDAGGGERKPAGGGAHRGPSPSVQLLGRRGDRRGGRRPEVLGRHPEPAGRSAPIPGEALRDQASGGLDGLRGACPRGAAVAGGEPSSSVRVVAACDPHREGCHAGSQAAEHRPAVRGVGAPVDPGAASCGSSPSVRHPAASTGSVGRPDCRAADRSQREHIRGAQGTDVDSDTGGSERPGRAAGGRAVGDRPHHPGAESQRRVEGVLGGDPRRSGPVRGISGAAEADVRGDDDAPCFDILNAGPRNRFMAWGRIVSNSGAGIQTQNMIRPSGLVDHTKTPEVFDDIRTGNYDLIELKWGPPFQVIADVLRGFLCAAPGKVFYIADYAQIEARIIAALAGQKDLIEVFASGGDVYKVTASKILGIPIEQITKDQRQLGKVLVLACLAADTEVLTRAGLKRIVDVQPGDEVWDGVEWVATGGLVGRGVRQTIRWEGVGVTPDHLVWTPVGWMPADEVANSSDAFQQSVLDLAASTLPPGAPAQGEPGWGNPGSAPVYDLLNCGPRSRFTIKTADGWAIVHNCGFGMGPGKFQDTALTYNVILTADEAETYVKAYRETNKKIKSYWYRVEEAAINATANPGAVFKVGDIAYKRTGRYLNCRLPSGRVLTYPYPRLEDVETPWGAIKKQLSYLGVDPVTKMPRRISAYGGLLAENITQAVASDCLRVALLRLRAAGLPVVLHIHDEVVVETEERPAVHARMTQILSELPDFAKAMGWLPGLIVAEVDPPCMRFRKG